MMRLRLDYTQHEAQNARNLLLWEQEVFSWAGSGVQETSGQGVKRSIDILLVGFALLYPLHALDSRLRGNDRTDAAECCRGFGGAPQFPNLPPRMGARGLNSISAMLSEEST